MIIFCHHCGKEIPSAVEESALRKLRDADPSSWEKLVHLRCMCTGRRSVEAPISITMHR